MSHVRSSFVVRAMVAITFCCGAPLMSQAVEEEPKDPQVETVDTVPTGTQSVTWALPGKAEFTASSDQFAKRGGWTVGQFRDALLKELAAVQDVPADFEKPTAGAADAPVGYVEYSYYVPPGYEPARPHGLMVYIHSGDGTSLGEQSKAILDKHNMIWVGAKGAGNNHAPIFRILLAMHGVEQIKARYAIDDERVYVSGFSGGGRAASIAAALMPDVFAGGFFFCGVNYYRNVGTNEKYWPGFCPRLDARILQAAQRNSRFVLQTGSADSNLANTRDVMGAFKQDRFNALYIEVPKGGHAMPPAEQYEEGITFLDAPLMAKVDALYKDAQALEKRKKYGDACVAYERAAARGADKPFATDATDRAAKIRKAYDKQVAEVRTLIVGDQPNKATPAVAQLRASFGPLADRDADVLTKEIADARKAKKPAP